MTNQMKAHSIEDVHVTMPAYGSNRTMAEFTYRGARYHVWFNITTRQIELHDKAPVLYKNPPLGVQWGMEAYFRTRHLDARKDLNARLLREMWLQIEQGDMIAKAVAASEAAEAEMLASRTARYAEHLKKLAGPQLYDACVLAERFFKQGGLWKADAIDALVAKLRDAITAAAAPQDMP